MAVDYSQYVKNYAQNVNVPKSNQPGLVGKGFAAIPTFAEKFNARESEAINSEFESANFSGLLDPNITTWQDVDIPNAGKAYLEFKGGIKDDEGFGAKRFARKSKKLMDPMVFKQKYDANLQMYLPTVLSNLSNYAVQNKKTTKEMRELLADKPGLKQFLMSNIPQDQLASYPYLIPEETFMDKWGWDQWGTAGKIGLGVAGLTAGKTVPWAYKAITGGKTRWTPPGTGGRAPGAVTETMKELNPAKAKADAAYKRAQEKFGKMDKRTKAAKTYKDRLAKFKTTVDKKSIIDPKNAKGNWNRLMSKYPKGKGLLPALTNKIGKKKALWIAAKLGIGSVMGLIPEPITTGVGMAMNAMLVYQVAKMLLDDE